MIDIDNVANLESGALDERIKKEELKQQHYNQVMEETRKKNLKEMYDAKKVAESQIPGTMLSIEEKIKSAIAYNRRYVEFSMGGDSNIIMFKQFMLVPMLMLNGFICEINGNRMETLKISW